jgi:hypothetical protein
VIKTKAELRSEATDEAPVVRELAPGELFAILDDSLGWAWGYAGAERRVGYLKSDALAS